MTGPICEKMQQCSPSALRFHDDAVDEPGVGGKELDQPVDVAPLQNRRQLDG